MGVATVSELKQQSVRGKRIFRSSLSTRQAAEWPLSDVSSDLTVEVGTSSFPLHKVKNNVVVHVILNVLYHFSRAQSILLLSIEHSRHGHRSLQFPLVSRSGKIRKLVSEAKDSKVTRINLQGTPGGAEAFELAAKFCYGVHIELDLSNAAMLSCAAHYLEMTEEFAEKNLELRAEIFLKEAVFPNNLNSITVLHRCESLLPVAEDINLISRIIMAIATNACKVEHTTGFATPEHGLIEVEATADWWGKALVMLNLDFFQRVLTAMKSKGLKQETVSRVLIYYAQNSIQGLAARDIRPSKCSLSDAETVKKQKIKVETIVSLLPTQSRKSPVPLAFLSGLLKTATMVSASTLCRADLERRIGIQLDQAILEDILIPASTHTGSHSLYDTDSIARIFSVFLNSDEEEDDDGAHLREARDSRYVHPNIKDSERYRLCKTIDCQKLSQEACSHAAQNERLPVQMAVQVLYFEQIRLRNAINGNHDQLFFGLANGQYSQRSGSGVGSGAISPRDCYASVRRENRELKLEVARMRIRLTDLEKDHVSMKKELVRPNPANKLLRSFTKKLSKLSSLFRRRDAKPLSSKTASDSRLMFQKRRRHSIS
ncbi:hypothetical protein C4D60_Mb01t14740 [Musa balbisiana]|uniref:NPH3 domain-containing protein n=1 Tax=Musa balbisiana TaxID=52838 RepID=A0A4S8JML3_MUSBA|nr:hypothetical protein C4D60_Mb01t14740 [Musa balbisiana]